MSRSVIVMDEKQRPLADADVQMYETDTGRVVRVQRTNRAGLATFPDPAVSTKIYWFRPLATRVNGNVTLSEI